MIRELGRCSITKYFFRRFFGSVALALVAYFPTGSWKVALAVGCFDLIFRPIFQKLYEYFEEKSWSDDFEPKPFVIWFTGLSGAGKSTLADSLYDELARHSKHIERLDGDSIRDLFPATGFTKQERDEHIRRIGYLASMLEKNGVIVVASFISPFANSRNFVRRLSNNFIEVYVATPLSECERRDVKGLYAKARRKQIRNFTGIDDPYEPPVDPEITIDTTGISVKAATNQVISYLRQNQLI